MPFPRLCLILVLLPFATTAVAADLAYLVKDINTNIAGYGSNPDRFLTFGNLAVFETTGSNGDSIALWRTDGTDAGTMQIGPAAFSKVIWNGRIWFVRDDARNEIWSTDGSSEAVKELTTTASTNITALLVDASYLYFAQAGKLWRTQGTAATTAQVGTTTFQSIGSWANFRGSLYFSAKQSGSGGSSGLWRADAAGPALVKHLGTAGNQFFYELTVVGSQLFMVEYFGTSPAHMWRSDGTTAGTWPLKSGQPIDILSFLRKIVASDTHAYFVGDDGTGSKLWSTDGTDAGTIPVASSMPGSTATFEGTIAGRLPNGTLLIFGPPLGASAGSVFGLWAVDGVNNTFLANVPVGNSAWLATVAGTYAIFGSGGELWRTDGTIGGTYTLGDIPGSDGVHNWPMTAVGTDVLFGAVDPTYGRELWKTDGTQANTRLLKDLTVATFSSDPGSFHRLRGGMVFSATSTATRDLWFSDGTEGGTTKLRDDFNVPLGAQTCGQRLFFTHATVEAGTELWSTDGTATGTQIVKDIVPGAASGGPGALVCANDQLFFTTWINNATTLWKTDGTEAGTLPIRALSIQSDLYPVGRHVYFAATVSTMTQLWRSDGTPGGTTVVKDLTGSLTHAIVAGPILYFTTSSQNQTSLWRSDGTGAGTSALLTDDFITLYAVFQGQAVFLWNHAGSRVGLCRTGGDTPVCFDDGPLSSGWWTFGVVPLNGRMLFNIPEVQVSDGSTSAPAGIGELGTFLEKAGGRVFATDSEENLLETDGTLEGTQEILGEDVDDAVASGGLLFISRGELYAYELPVVAISFAPQAVEDGGQTVTISGRGFTGPVALTIGGAAVAATLISSTTITFVAPDLQPGTYPVALTLGDGRQLTLDEPLRYSCSRPAAAVEPVTGVVPFGSSVVLHGSGAARCAWFPRTGLDDPTSCTPTATPAVSTTYTLVVFNDEGCASANYPSVRVTVTPAAPTLNYAFRGEVGEVFLNWSAAGAATAYEILRSTAGSSPQVVATVTTVSHTERPPVGGTYLYRIRAINADGASAASNADWASTFSFTDPNGLNGVKVGAAHFSELRAVIDDIGVLAGLERAVWTDPVITPRVTAVRAAHVLEMRERLAAAYAALGKPAPQWPSVVSPGSWIKADAIYELRGATY